MIKGEEGFITAILTQAVEDAKYTGLSKKYNRGEYDEQRRIGI